MSERNKKDFDLEKFNLKDVYLSERLIVLEGEGNLLSFDYQELYEELLRNRLASSLIALEKLREDITDSKFLVRWYKKLLFNKASSFHKENLEKLISFLAYRECFRIKSGYYNGYFQGEKED